VIDGYTAIHWDIRPHPRFGTLEVRMPDQPTDVERTGALVELLRALCAWAIEQPAPSHDASSRVVYDQNRFAAARFGPRATLIHPERDAPVTVPELFDDLASRIGFAGLDPSVCEADVQLEFDDARGAAADVVTRSLP
jgi:carboxylate-amine ligase